MSLTRRQLIARGAAVAGGLLTHGSILSAGKALAAGCIKSWELKNCSNVQPSVCGGAGCVLRWSNPSSNGGTAKTIIAYSPSNQFYGQCACDADTGCICQVRVCVCNAGMCACKLFCDCG